MELVVKARNLVEPSKLRNYVQRRLSFAFDRHENYILRVEVRLEDINGPKGGKDKQCRIQIVLNGFGSINIGHIDSDIFNAIDKAATKAFRSIASRIDRRKRRSNLVPGQREKSFDTEEVWAL